MQTHQLHYLATRTPFSYACLHYRKTSVYGSPQNFFSRGNVDIVRIIFRLLTKQCKCTFTKLPFLRHKENAPC